ncbi:MAG: hypothetical protein F9K15_19480, partial [Zoogloea sp.]
MRSLREVCQAVPRRSNRSNLLQACQRGPEPGLHPAPESGLTTGLLPPAEREERIAQLQNFDKRVLVCTDCLSEGINLQELFNA